MASLALQIPETGVSAPDFDDILAQIKILFWGIYGQDANLDADSQDGQWVAQLAAMINDCNQAGIAVYNAFSPVSAQGIGLSNVVKINGLKRLVPTASQATVSIGGSAGTVITNGLVGDSFGFGTQWSLPETVTIPDAGTIDVVATCTVLGAVSANIGSLTNILTPTRGWQTVTNAAVATEGEPVETDATLRRRQSVSTALPAETILEGIDAALANLAGVGRLRVYENDTDITDGNGIPSHSISAVVEGGQEQDIGETIAIKKCPGTGTYGSTSVVVIDQKGVPSTIRYYKLAEVTIAMDITINVLAGYVSTTGDLIKASLAQFVSGLGVGEIDYLSRLYAPANLSGDAAIEATGLTQAQLDALARTYNVAFIGQGRDGDPPAAVDISIAFNEAALLLVGDIALTLA